jgi:F-type H+-transporting ATPase subunit gamma
MAGQLKEVRNRIKSIQSTQQITKAMKMISATKLRKAQEAIQQMWPYSKKLQQVLSNIAGNADGETGSSLSVARHVDKVLLILITSDRASCGAYNSTLIKLAKATMKEKYPAQAAKGNITIWSIGKKGYEHFLKNNYKVNGEFRDIFHHLNFESVQLCAQAAVKAFEKGEFDAIDIIYSEFKNAASQNFVVEHFLPIPKAKKVTGAVANDFIFEPSKGVLLMELMPKILNTQLFKAVLDANASEHGARMTAMDKATENANEILKTLRISYNRARQAAITTELTEIVSGAAALKG